MSNFRFVEANNPFESYNIFEELSEIYCKQCIDIVPLESKPMALGACLYAIEHSDIRVIFS